MKGHMQEMNVTFQALYLYHWYSEAVISSVKLGLFLWSASMQWTVFGKLKECDFHCAVMQMMSDMMFNFDFPKLKCQASLSIRLNLTFGVYLHQETSHLLTVLSVFGIKKKHTYRPIKGKHRSYLLEARNMLNCWLCPLKMNSFSLFDPSPPSWRLLLMHQTGTLILQLHSIYFTFSSCTSSTFPWHLWAFSSSVCFGIKCPLWSVGYWISYNDNNP